VIYLFFITFLSSYYISDTVQFAGYYDTADKCGQAIAIQSYVTKPPRHGDTYVYWCKEHEIVEKFYQYGQ